MNDEKLNKTPMFCLSKWMDRFQKPHFYCGYVNFTQQYKAHNEWQMIAVFWQKCTFSWSATNKLGSSLQFHHMEYSNKDRVR